MGELEAAAEAAREYLDIHSDVYDRPSALVVLEAVLFRCTGRGVVPRGHVCRGAADLADDYPTGSP